MSSIFIRTLEASDLPEVYLIEAKATPFPWSKKAHQDSVEETYPSLALQVDNELAGFIIFNFLADECHLLNIVVAPDFQGMGYAKLMVLEMIEKANVCKSVSKSNSINQVILEVRSSNQAAINLYNQLGFSQIGTRKNYYRGHLLGQSSREDAIVMQKAL